MSESAPPEKRVRSKFTPTVKVWCDEIVVKDEEGNEYYPHAGEWVKFKTSVTIEVAGGCPARPDHGLVADRGRAG
jgi:hypothetical protein